MVRVGHLISWESVKRGWEFVKRRRGVYIFVGSVWRKPLTDGVIVLFPYGSLQRYGNCWALVALDRLLTRNGWTGRRGVYSSETCCGQHACICMDVRSDFC